MSFLEETLSFEITPEQVHAAVDEKLAAAPEEFDVLEFVRGTATPEDTVTIFTDADAAVKIADIVAAEAARDEDSLSIADESEIDEGVFNELHARLTASALELTLKGIAPAARVALENHLKATLPYREGELNEEYNEALNYELVSRSIKGVTRLSTGAVSSTEWTPERVKSFLDELYVSEQNKVYFGVMKVTYVSDIFDKAVTADFS